MDGFSKRARAKREAVLDAALALFAAQGIKETGVAAIARRAQVSQVTLYKYFGSKHNLARCAVGRYYDRLLEDFARVIQGPLSFPEKIEQAFFAPLQKEADTNPIFWQELLGAAFVDMVFSYEEKLMPLMLGFIREGQQAGHIGRGYAGETLLVYIRVFSAQAMQSFASVGHDPHWQQKYHQLMHLFLYGIRGDKEDCHD